jgi:hypothetical protein
MTATTTTTGLILALDLGKFKSVAWGNGVSSYYGSQLSPKNELTPFSLYRRASRATRRRVPERTKAARTEKLGRRIPGRTHMPVGLAVPGARPDQSRILLPEMKRDEKVGDEKR